MNSCSNYFAADKLINSGLPENIASGMDLLSRDTYASSVYSKYLLGRVHEFGIGVQKDHDRARLYYLDAMNSEDLIEQDYLASQFSHDTHGPEIVDLQPMWFRKNLDKGSENAKYDLGLCYQQAIGVALDLNQAVHFFKMSFANGNWNAAAVLANLYEELGGHEADRLAALEFAASHGDGDSLYQLAVIYREGKCVEADLDRSMTLLAKAVKEGLHALAQLDLATFELNPNSAYYAPRQGVTHLADLLRRNQKYRLDVKVMSDVCWRLGRCWLTGTAVEKNDQHAMMAFRLAATFGHEEATDEFWLLHESLENDVDVELLSGEQFYESTSFLIEQLKDYKNDDDQTWD